MSTDKLTFICARVKNRLNVCHCAINQRKGADVPNKRGAFTPRERALIGYMAGTGDLTYSAHKAGYAGESGARGAMARPAVALEVFRVQQARIQNEVLPLAVMRHLEVLNDRKVTGQPLNRAIEMAYKYGLGAGDDGRRKEAHEMTAEELANAIDTLKRAASERASPVLDLTAAPGVFE